MVRHKQLRSRGHVLETWKNSATGPVSPQLKQCPQHPRASLIRHRITLGMGHTPSVTQRHGWVQCLQAPWAWMPLGDPGAGLVWGAVQTGGAWPPILTSPTPL